MPEGTIDADSISLFLFCGQQGNNPFKKELGAFFFLPKAVVIGAMCHCWLCIMRIYMGGGGGLLLLLAGIHHDFER